MQYVIGQTKCVSRNITEESDDVIIGANVLLKVTSVGEYRILPDNFR